MDPVVVQLKNSRLLRSDIDILNDPNGWISDSIIGVWFDYLETYNMNYFYNRFHKKENDQNRKNENHFKGYLSREKMSTGEKAFECTTKDESGSQLLSPPFCFLPLARKPIGFIDPSTAFWILLENDPEDLKNGLQPLQLQNKGLLLIPINNSTSTLSPCSGTHWSLLIYSETKLDIEGYSNLPKFIHINSSGKLCDDNAINARCVATKLTSFLVYPSQETADFTASVPSEENFYQLQNEIDYMDVQCGPQQDSYNCGIWVILIAEEIGQAFMGSSPAKLGWSYSEIQKKRQKIKKTLLKFQESDHNISH